MVGAGAGYTRGEPKIAMGSRSLGVEAGAMARKILKINAMDRQAPKSSGRAGTFCGVVRRRMLADGDMSSSQRCTEVLTGQAP